MTEKRNPKTLVDRTTNLHIRFVKDVNDTSIFLQALLPLLQTHKASFKVSEYVLKQTFSVPPAKAKSATAKRTPQQIRNIYERFISRELYQNFIITSIARFESYLSDVLMLALLDEPEKLKLDIVGKEKERNIPLEYVLETTTRKELFERIAVQQVTRLFYRKPAEYLQYIQKILQVPVTDISFKRLIELKATRDLLVHNSLIINDTYLEKVDKKFQRGVKGETIVVDEDYFQQCLATLKRTSQIISKNE